MSNSSRWPHRKVMAALLISLVILWSCKLYGSPLQSTAKEAILRYTAHDVPQSSSNLTYLTSNLPDLSPGFMYSQRIIKTEHFNGERPDLTVKNGTFFPDAQMVDRDNLSHVDFERFAPLTLRVPASPVVDTSIFSFGIATRYGRMREALDQLVHWLPNSGCPLHMVAPPDSTEDTYGIQETFHDSGVNLTVVESDLEFPVAYFSLLKVLYDTRLPNTKWLVLIDDDTFVPSLPSLAEYMSTFDSSKEMLVAAATEDKRQLETWGLITYGGGGVFISIPLAERLLRPETWDTCITGMGESQGDGILSSCLFHYTSIRPTFSPYLNQMDFRASAAGIFESGRRMLTIHHWRTWFRASMPLAGRSAKACGDEGILQRWIFPQSNALLSNGYSITLYPSGVEWVDFEAVEKTWEGEAGRFLHAIGPLREAMTVEEKVTYALEAVEDVKGLGTRQLYVRRELPKEDGSQIDQVLELLWLY